MIKALIISTTLLLSSAMSVFAQKSRQKNKNTPKSEVKFLDNIEVEVGPSSIEQRSQLTELEAQYFAKQAAASSNITNTSTATPAAIENASNLQLKYALLLDTEVEQVQNISLINNIEQWYGTRYRLGGTTKDGIDCSAFVQILFVTQWGINLPRTAREQYDATTRISRTELKEGDLVFFNTTGGVSHVGMYLQNNKFVHASSSGGVTISDLFDPYWERRFVGVGRYEKQKDVLVTASRL